MFNLKPHVFSKHIHIFNAVIHQMISYSAITTAKGIQFNIYSQYEDPEYEHLVLQQLPCAPPWYWDRGTHDSDSYRKPEIGVK